MLKFPTSQKGLAMSTSAFFNSVSEHSDFAVTRGQLLAYSDRKNPIVDAVKNSIRIAREVTFTDQNSNSVY